MKVDRGHVVVNEWLETGEPGVYAIGDLVGPPWLGAQGEPRRRAVRRKHCRRRQGVHPLDTSKIPGCTYCWPQVASIGMTEQAAKDAGPRGQGRPLPGHRQRQGDRTRRAGGVWLKTVFDAKTGELLGAHMIGAEVTELIQGFAVARTLESTESELMEAIFPHPTLSEMMHESVLDAYGRVIHI